MAHYREVTRAGGKAYEVRWREGGKFEQRTFPTEDAAAEFVVELKLTKRDVGTTTHLKKLGKKFEEVAQMSMDAGAHRLKPSTRGNYEVAYRLHINPTFGHRRINSITSMEVERWLADMLTKVSPDTGKPYSASSVRGAYIALNKAFNYALRHRLIPSSPCVAVEKPRLVRQEQSFLLPEQVAAIVQELNKVPPYGLLVKTAAYTGLRAGELAALRIGDVMLMRPGYEHVKVQRTVSRVEGEWVFSQPKSANSVRDVPLPGFLVAELREYIDAHPRRSEPSAPLWPARRRGGYGTNRGALVWDGQISIGHVYATHFLPALERLGIPHMRWHDLRHFYASVCASKGIDIYDVSTWLGHANVSITQSTYVHLFKRSHSDAMSRLDEAASVPAAAPLRRIG
jgi:integrase